VELLNLLRRVALEPDSSSIREGCGFPIDRLADAKRTTVVPIEVPDPARTVQAEERLLRSEYAAKQRIVEALGTLNII
jgi:hypothetical protein